MCTDSEPLQLKRETFPVARKQYKCCERGSDIGPGEKYQCITGLFEGQFDTYRTCLICANIRAAAEKDLGYGIAFTCLYDTVGSDFEEEGL